MTVAVLATTSFSAVYPGSISPGPISAEAPATVVESPPETPSSSSAEERMPVAHDPNVESPAIAGDRAIAPPPDQFDGPPGATAPLPDELERFVAGERRPGGGVWAVVIGIDDYPGSRSDLRSAVDDADDVDRALARFGVPSDRRLVVRDRQASAETIGIAADWLVANSNADATAVFFYAGHARRHSAARHAMVGADGTTITDLDLRDRLKGLRAGQTWIGVAACYGGGFDELVTTGRLLTAAADADHLAYENQSFGRSYMVEFMIRRAMLEGAAPASVQAAFDYADASLDREYPNRRPFEIDASTRAIDLRESRDSAADQETSTPASTPTPSDRADAPADGPGKDESPEDGCAALTFGVVQCDA